MTETEIIEAAREAGISAVVGSGKHGALKRFVKLIEQRMLELAAVEAENWDRHCAAAIRALKEK